MSRFSALPKTSNGIERVITTECGISEAFSIFEMQQKLPHPQITQFNAVSDTGASSSAISPRVVSALGLIPTGWGFSDTAAGRSKVQKYGVNVLLPNGVGFRCMEVSCNNMKVDVLIGMDIICQGDFCVTNKNGKSIFTFQTPSSHDYDFVKEIDKFRKIHETWAKHGNTKCPCGRGLSWDKCHGKK